MIRARALLPLLAAALASCGPAPADTPETPGRYELLTENGYHLLIVQSSPAPIPLQADFSLSVEIHESTGTQALVTEASLAAQLIGPGGAESSPEVTAHGDGTFTVSGLRCDTSGEWEIALDVLRQRVSDRAVVRFSL